MSVFRIYKEISSVPTPYIANAMYAVRAGDGVDIYVANSTGTQIHKHNTGGVSTYTAGDGIDVANGIITNTQAPASIVLDNTLANPTTITDFNSAYIVASGATGAWSGQTNKIATTTNNGASWTFTNPTNGMRRQISGGANAGNTYQYNGSAWILQPTVSSAIYGDVKNGVQPTDHQGWVRLDGRLKSTLTTTQQAQATALGIGANLPNATNAYMSQTGGTLGIVSGSNSKIIAQNQLPNVRLFYAVNGEGVWQWGPSAANSIADLAHQGNNAFSADLAWSNSEPTGGRTSSINGNVTQQSINIQPQTLSVNTFIYLGN